MTFPIGKQNAFLNTHFKEGKTVTERQFLCKFR